MIRHRESNDKSTAMQSQRNATHSVASERRRRSQHCCGKAEMTCEPLVGARLGHLLNPTDLLSDDREWIAKVWESIIASAHGISPEKITIREFPSCWTPLDYESGNARPDGGIKRTEEIFRSNQAVQFSSELSRQIFWTSGRGAAGSFPFGCTVRIESGKWVKMSWIDQYSGKHFRITT